MVGIRPRRLKSVSRLLAIRRSFANQIADRIAGASRPKHARSCHGIMSSLLATGLLLSGCASTRSTEVSDGSPPESTVVPSRIVIVVSDCRHTGNKAENRPLALQERGEIEAALKNKLTTDMKWDRGGVMIADGNLVPISAHNTLLLHVMITGLASGNQALRLAVGFGAGRATLQIKSQLVDLRGVQPINLTAFVTRSTTGAMPGPGLGLATAASSGSILGIAGGSAGLFLGSRETLRREIDQSSTQIVAHLQTYFEQQHWPAFPPSGRSFLQAGNALPPPRPVL